MSFTLKSTDIYTRTRSKIWQPWVPAPFFVANTSWSCSLWTAHVVWSPLPICYLTHVFTHAFISLVCLVSGDSELKTTDKGLTLGKRACVGPHWGPIPAVQAQSHCCWLQDGL